MNEMIRDAYIVEALLTDSKLKVSKLIPTYDRPSNMSGKYDRYQVNIDCIQPLGI